MTGKLCPDCDVPRFSHVGDWLSALVPFSAPKFLPLSLVRILNARIDDVFVTLGLMRRVWDKNIPLIEVSPRTRVFLKSLMKAGLSSYVLKSPAGWTAHIGVRTPQGLLHFEGLPTAEDFGGTSISVENKWKEKQFILAQGAPAPEGRTFYFWQEKAARMYVKDQLGYPVAVKPTGGTMARHVTFGIADDAMFHEGFARARRYGPRILVEKHMPGFVHRITVLGGEQVFCVRQEPPLVVGDGVHSVAELVETENNNPTRGPIGSVAHMQHKILLADDTPDVLREQGIASLEDIPAAGTRFYLRRDPFLRNGGGLVHLTNEMHDDFRTMVRTLAQASGIFIVGIDVMAEDITRPMSTQTCGVLEMNAIPFIEMHVESENDTKIGDALVEAMQQATRMART